MLISKKNGRRPFFFDREFFFGFFKNRLSFVFDDFNIVENIYISIIAGSIVTLQADFFLNSIYFFDSNIWLEIFFIFFFIIIIGEIIYQRAFVRVEKTA